MSAVEAKLMGLREQIDRVDEQLVALIAERVRLAGQVGAVKRVAGLSVYDRARETQVLARAVGRGRMAKVNEGVVRKVFEEIIELCRLAQRC
jgi:chorismate mutase